MPNFDGISFDGKPVEDFLANDKRVEINNIVTEERIKQKQSKQHRRERVKHMDHTEPHGDVTTYTQRQLNKANLESNLKKAKTQKQKIIALLLGGDTITSAVVALRLGVNKSWCANVLGKLYKSALGTNYIVRQGNRTTGFFHTMSPAGLNLTPQDAFNLSGDMSNPKPTLPDVDVSAVKGVAKATEAEYKVTASEFDAAIHEAVEEIGKKFNVNVSGKVEVVFRWER